MVTQDYLDMPILYSSIHIAILPSSVQTGKHKCKNEQAHKDVHLQFFSPQPDISKTQWTTALHGIPVDHCIAWYVACLSSCFHR